MLKILRKIFDSFKNDLSVVFIFSLKDIFSSKILFNIAKGLRFIRPPLKNQFINFTALVKAPLPFYSSVEEDFVVFGLLESLIDKTDIESLIVCVFDGLVTVSTPSLLLMFMIDEFNELIEFGFEFK